MYIINASLIIMILSSRGDSDIIVEPEAPPADKRGSKLAVNAELPKALPTHKPPCGPPPAALADAPCCTLCVLIILTR